ncbi:MAG: hypothetical protein JXM68_07575, partial [Sedimentisphaerales bacterium]|nr:hypothetical protein [Sedimentisphaerales bacterium]
TLKQKTDERPINIGTDTSLGLLETEIDTITANILQIGDTNSGAITISSSFGPDNVNTLNLTSGSTILSGINIIAVDTLNMNAGAKIDVDTAVSNISAISAAGNIIIDNTGDLTVSNAIPSAGSDFSLFIESDSITVIGWTLDGNDDVTLIATSGDITIPDGGGSTASDDINLGTGSRIRLEALLGGIAAGSVIGITGEELIIKSNSSQFLVTSVAKIDAEITGAGSNLDIREKNGLSIEDLDGDDNAMKVESGYISVEVSAGNLYLEDTIQASGQISLLATVNISQINPVIINGITDMEASGNIILNEDNDFVSTLSFEGSNVSLVDINDIDLGNSSASGTLGVTAEGSITDSGAIT